MKKIQLNSVNHQGTVIAFARDSDSGALYYNVLDLHIDSVSDNDDWTGYTLLPLPSQVRPLGAGLLTFDNPGGVLLVDANQPYQVVSDQTYICLFRQSSRGSLLLNRFLFRRSSEGNDASATPVLEPCWEVRFVRSGKQDVPAGTHDTQNYLDPDGAPFIEPTLELAMINDLAGGAFDVLLLPNEESGGNNWQIFAYDNAGTAKKCRLFSFPRTATGLPDLMGKPLDAAGNIGPDAAFQLQTPSAGVLPFALGPSAVYYAKQEQVRTATDATLRLKRSGRVMLAVPVQPAGQPLVMGIVDFGVNKQGQLSSIMPLSPASAISPANYALRFDAQAYLALANDNNNSLAITTGFELTTTFWAEPGLAARQQLVGGQAQTAANHLPPYLCLLSSGALEAGFGTGSAAITCVTAAGVVAPATWYEVTVRYDATAAASNFTMLLNGGDVAVTGTLGANAPQGTALAQVGGGFAGLIDGLKVSSWSDGVATLLASWDFDNVNYINPAQPFTPSSTAGLNQAAVFGARLEPSASPAQTSTAGLMQLGADGLATFVGYLDFVQPSPPPTPLPAVPPGTAPYLLAGSDGLNHLYFQNAAGMLCVAQYDVTMSRAVFQSSWQAKSNTAANATTSGGLNFVAARNGTYLNEATVVISDGLVANLCRVVLSDSQGTVETWLGVPREATALQAALSGQTSSDPNDPLLLTGRKIFYDAQGHYPMSHLPVASGEQYLYLDFVSCLPDQLPLASIAVQAADPKTQTCTLVAQFRPLKWNPVGGPGAPVLLTQTWPNLPTACGDFLSALNGSAGFYDYSSTSSTDAPVYALPASSALGQGKNSALLFFTKPGAGVSALALTVADGSTADCCTLTVSVTLATGPGQVGTWAQAPRDQVALAALLTNPQPAGAPADNQAVAALLLVLTDGLAATVPNHAPAATDAGNMLAGASLFNVFNNGYRFGDERVQNQAPLPASVLQGATRTTPAAPTPAALLSGSTLFGVVMATEPTSGLVALADNTSAAALVQYGSNSGWLQEPDDFALTFGGSSYVRVDATTPAANLLAPSGDMSLELWCKPALDLNLPPQQRLLTGYKQGNLDLPDQAFQYLLGLERSNCLAFNNYTYINGAYNFADPAPFCSLQVWVNPQGAIETGNIGTLSTIGITQYYLQLGIDSGGNYQLVYGPEALGVVLTGSQGPSLNQWQCLAATMGPASGQQVQLTLYLDGVVIGTIATALQTPANPVGSFMVGSPSDGVTMYANGATLWKRALDPVEVRQYYERIPADTDEDLVIKLNLVETSGTSAGNSASNTANPSFLISNPIYPSWLQQGVYFAPFAANRSLGVVSNQFVLGPAWNHLAAVYDTSYALRFRGHELANCGNNASLNPNGKFSLDLWLKPDRLGAQQLLLSKAGTYELGLNSSNQVYCKVWTSQATVLLTSTATVAASAATYVVFTFDTHPTPVPGGSTSAVTPTYTLSTCLYMNGVLDSSSSVTSYTTMPEVANPATPLTMGAHAAGYNYYAGALSEPRVWGSVLALSDVQLTYATHQVSPQAAGLISYWPFDEQRGKTAYDQNGLNNARLSTNDLWNLFEYNATLRLYLNGGLLTDVRPLAPATYGGYGLADTFAIGVLPVAPAYTNGYAGQLNELRLWSEARRPEQLADNMYRELAGNETHLAGYWPFEEGSGVATTDQTGNGNNGTLCVGTTGLPSWGVSEAPLSNENQQVYNVLGGLDTAYLAEVSETPAVVEYADTQRDAAGALFSVMKRCYLSAHQGRATLLAGYKVGDLDTVYVGQVQTKPTVIGYLEGAPPIPSENQTMPFWISDLDPSGAYAGMSTVQLSEADEVVRTYSSSMQDDNSRSLDGQAGVFLSTGAGESVGIGAELEWNTYSLEGHIGYQGNTSSNATTSSDQGFGAGTNFTKVEKLTAGGDWEDPAALLNPAVGRRYVPDSVGYALVKSLTADLYVVRLKGSGSMVKLSIVPNADIPEDVNIITFPLNPRYLKNGTLDGKVGLVNDPDYPDADTTRASYFKPLEAYALKRAIERQDKQQEAFYQQFNTGDYTQPATVGLDGKVLTKGGWQDFKDNALAKSPAYDWQKRLTKRNMLNAYVWTAAGGLYSVSESVANTYSESYGSLDANSSTDGLHFDLAGAYIVGLYGEVDALWGQSLTISATKSSEQSAAFSLEVEASPDGLLKAPLIEGGVMKGYGPALTPGKVDAYRFMSFFLAPSQDNFDFLLSDVIDYNWLRNSTQPAAVALRSAAADTNGVWRVLHRVTYVSRVPPAFQAVPVQTQGPDITPPANLPDNTTLVRFIASSITVPAPSPAVLGMAIQAALGTSAGPGTLAAVYYWWPAFLAQAEVPRSVAYRQLYELRLDLLRYLGQYYDWLAVTGPAASPGLLVQRTAPVRLPR